MSLRLCDNLANFQIGQQFVGGGNTTSYNWPSPVVATGTGQSQAIELPQSGLSIGDIMVFENSILKTTGYHISDRYLVLTSPPGSQLYIVRYGAGATGPRGEMGPTGSQGIKGDPGEPFIIMGVLPAVRDLPPNGPANRAWIVESNLYVWEDGLWVNMGDIMNSSNGGYDYDMDGGNF